MPNHQWIWRPADAVDPTLDAQLDAIWDALAPRAKSFHALGPEAQVVVDILIEHHGDDLVLGWEMSERHVAMAAAFGASVSVDEYDYTDDD